MAHADESISTTVARPDAVRIKARDVRVGDTVFGPNGEEDTVAHVSISTSRTLITPTHRWPLSCTPDDDITVRRT